MSSLEETGWTPQYIRVTLDVDASVADKQWCIKAYAYHDGAVFWSLLDIVGGFLPGSSISKAGKWLARLDLRHFEDHLDTSIDCQVMPSLKAAMCDAECDLDNYIREEWTITTYGLLGLLIHFATFRHAGEDKERAASMLCGLLQLCLSSDSALADDRHLQLRDATSEECEEWLGQGVIGCQHMAPISARLAEASGDQWARELVPILRGCNSAALACPSAKLYLRGCVEMLASDIDQVAQTCPFESDPSVGLNIRPRPSKSYVDEDFKRMSRGVLVANKRARTARGYVRSTGVRDPSATSFWESQFCSNYLCALRMSAKCTGVCSVAEDAARNGRPAEDTHFYLFWDSDANMGVYLLPQVVRSWHGAEKVGGTEDELEREASERVAQRIGDVISGRQHRKASLQESMQANREHARALDSALRTLPISGISHFRTDLGGFPGFTRPGHDMFEVPADELPEDLRAALQGRTRRACWQQEGCEDAALMVLWTEPRPSLWNALDMGSVGWQSKPAIYLRAGTRGSWVFDTSHRSVRVADGAYTRSGMRFVRVDWNIVLAYLVGPYDNNMHYQSFRDLAKEIFGTFDVEFELFQLLYPWFVEEIFEGRTPPGCFTRDHQNQIWNRIQTLQILKDMTWAVKPGRWFAWERKMDETEKGTFSLMCMVLMYKLICVGKLHDVRAIPHFGGIIGDTIRREAGPDSGGDVPPSGAAGSSGDPPPPPPANVKMSSAETDKSVRAKAHGAAMCVVSTIANRTSWKLQAAMVEITRPLRERHGMNIALLATQTGCLDFWVTCSSGSGHGQMERVWSALKDTKVLRKLGLLSAHGSACEGRAKEDHVVSSAAVSLARNLVWQEAITQSWFHCRPPGCFFGLLSDKQAVRDETLRRCSELFEALRDAEKSAGTNEDVNNLLWTMQWPWSGWEKEILVGLYEAEFKCVPHDIREELEKVGRSLLNTRPNECLNGSIQSLARANSGLRIGRISKWHRAIHSNMLEDNDRKQPVVTQAIRMHRNKERVQNRSFEANKNTISIDELVLKAYLTDPEYPMPSVPVYFDSAAATERLLNAKKDYSRLDKSWLAMLATPGTMIAHAHVHGRRGYVLGATTEAVLVWKCKQETHGGKKYARFEIGGDSKNWCFEIIDKVEDWRQKDIIEHAPTGAHEHQGPGAPRDGIQLEVVGSVKTLLRGAAEQGFRFLTVELMKRLLAYLELAPNPAPRTEFDYAKALIDYGAPGATDEQKAEYLRQRARGDKDAPKFEHTLSEADLEMCSDVLDAADLKVMKHDVRSYAAEVLEYKQGLVAAAKAAAKPSAKKKKIGALKDKSAVAEARRLIPSASGCGISLETEWHLRWRGTYKRRFPPHVNTAVFPEGNLDAMRRALLSVLRWQWEEHTAVTKEVCPYDLSQ